MLDHVGDVDLGARDPGGLERRVELRDRFQLARPGETEIRFEDSPGIAVERARVGDDTEPGIDYKIIGPTPVLGAAGPAGGIEIAFTAGPGAV
ncbi:MAG TPA: hypothetical protein VK607_07835, partial [Kofleriaceae bacterium]|nr:hypothetical protein [Kofleriaceae bacterium]